MMTSNTLQEFRKSLEIISLEELKALSSQLEKKVNEGTLETREFKSAVDKLLSISNEIDFRKFGYRLPYHTYESLYEKPPRQAKTREEKLKEEKVPDINSLSGWNDWINDKIEYYGEYEFFNSTVYKKAAPFIQVATDKEKLQQREKKEKIIAQRLARFNKTKLKEGDAVETSSRATSPLAPSMVLKGTIKIYPRLGVMVLLDKYSTSITGKKRISWNEDWVKR